MTCHRPGRAHVPAILVTLALGLSACSSTSWVPPAATVDGDAISQAEVREELEILEANPEYTRVLLGGSELSDFGSSDAITADLSQALLGRKIVARQARAELANRGIAVDPAARTLIENDSIQSFGVAFEDLPTGYRGELVESNAALITLGETLADDAGTPRPDGRAFYDANTDQFSEICLRHILIQNADNLGPVQDALEAGTPFGDVATEFSVDGSGAQGGDLGCHLMPTPFDPDFLAGALSTPVGEVSNPVPTQFGIHLILVDSFEVVPYDEVSETATQAAEQIWNESLNAELGQWLTSNGADVEINPRYGRWDPETARVEADAEGVTYGSK